jgi:hypothetical protein
LVSGHVGSRYAQSIRTAGKRRRIREGLVKKERRHGTVEGFAKGVSGDARQGGTGLSILVRFEVSNVVYAIDDERCIVHAGL